MARKNQTPEEKTGVAAWNESAGIRGREQANTHTRRNRAQAEKRKRVAALVALLIVCVASLVCAWPIKDQIARGLWLKGGTAYTITAIAEDGGDPSADELSSAASAIQSRLGASGVTEYAVSTSGNNAIVEKLPDFEDAESLAKLVGGSGFVEFVDVDEIGDADALTKLNAGAQGVAVDKDTYTSFIDGTSVKEASVVDAGSGTYAVRIVFDDEGAKTFADVTKELAEDMGRIAVVIDGRIISAPSVSQEISGGEVYITGDFSKEEANSLKAMLDGETIPLTLTYAGSQEIGALLGKTKLWGMVGIVVAAFVVVCILAYRRFRKLALLVAGAALVYAALMLGLMALASRVNMFVLTIPGVFGGAWCAAVTLMAVWLVSARFQERANEGRSIKGAATSAPPEALKPLAMPCGIAFVVACVLLFVPMPALRDFGLAVVLGVVCGLVAIYWYAVTTLRLCASGPVQANPRAWGIAGSSEGEEASQDAS